MFLCLFHVPHLLAPTDMSLLVAETHHLSDAAETQALARFRDGIYHWSLTALQAGAQSLGRFTLESKKTPTELMERNRTWAARIVRALDRLPQWSLVWIPG